MYRRNSDVRPGALSLLAILSGLVLIDSSSDNVGDLSDRVRIVPLVNGREAH
jgi:hypothetical protein